MDNVQRTLLQEGDSYAWEPFSESWVQVEDDSHPELVSGSLSYAFARGKKCFELKNHLGNVLATVSDHHVSVFASNDFQHYLPVIVSATDYYAFGGAMPGRDYSSSGYRYGFNGKENDREWGGQLIQDYGFRMYNPSLGRFLSVDPLMKDYPMLTPYQFASNKPINGVDMDGLEHRYAMDGTYMGQGPDLKSTDVQVMVKSTTYTVKEITWKDTGLWGMPQAVVTNRTVTRRRFETLKTADGKNLTHNDFRKSAATVYGESSAYKLNTVTEDLKNEMFGIAYVLTRNSTAYGADSEQAKKYMNRAADKQNAFMKTANAAIINERRGGEDPSKGADMWDGAEQALYKKSDNRASTGKFELHMNTMGWKISDEHYKKWKENVGKSFKAPQEKASPQNYPKKGYYNKGKKVLESTAVHGRTIFWRDTSKKKK